MQKNIYIGLMKTMYIVLYRMFLFSSRCYNLLLFKSHTHTHTHTQTHTATHPHTHTAEPYYKNFTKTSLN